MAAEHRASRRGVLAATTVVGLTAAMGNDTTAKQGATMATITHLNPEGMHSNPAYTQAVVVSGPVKTIYIGGQNPVDASGKLVGEGDIAAQTEQILDNVETILTAAGATLQSIIKMTLLLVEGTDPLPGLIAFQKRWGQGGNPPAITAAYVSGLAVPGVLAEIEAIAVVPE